MQIYGKAMISSAFDKTFSHPGGDRTDRVHMSKRETPINKSSATCWKDLGGDWGSWQLDYKHPKNQGSAEILFT